MAEDFLVFVSFPSAPLTESLVRKAIEKTLPNSQFISVLEDIGSKSLLQWASYDVLDHSLTLEKKSNVISSSYIIRKALIRKHYLHRAIQGYVTKNPGSILKRTVPETWDFDVAFADELEELWHDDLYDLSDRIEQNPHQWWILKPGMADRGNGLRIFKTKNELAQILEEFEAAEDAAESEDVEAPVLSQLRNFVVQKYLDNTVLFNPFGLKESLLRISSETQSKGHKFHLRAYCVASGALEIFLYPKILALFAPEPYQSLATEDLSAALNMRSHLTNTSRHADTGDTDHLVHLLEELVGYPVLGGPFNDANTLFTNDDVSGIITQIKDILSDVFQAALSNPVHFLPLPNVFELFGVDFLVSHAAPAEHNNPSSSYCISLLEFNSEPAIEMTGSRLEWILQNLFMEIGRVCVGSRLHNFSANFSNDKMNTNENAGDELLPCYSVKIGR